jgi:serine/threonine protein kinase
VASEEEVVGTPAYMAPEQCCGDGLDARTDVYSLGVLAWEMFLEGLPFTGDSPVAIMAGHISGVPGRPRTLWPDIPDQLETLLLGMLAKRPSDRPSIGGVVEALEQVELALEARRSGMIELRRPRRAKTAGALPAFFIAAAITVASLYAAVGVPDNLTVDLAAWASR